MGGRRVFHPPRLTLKRDNIPYLLFRINEVFRCSGGKKVVQCHAVSCTKMGDWFSSASIYTVNLMVRVKVNLNSDALGLIPTQLQAEKSAAVGFL